MANRKGQGRKPKPTALKLLHGDDKKNPQRINVNEPEAPEGKPDCPEWLDDTGKKAWEWLSDTLEKMRMLSPAYAKTMELYADAYSKWMAANEMVNKVGQAIVVKTKGGTEIRRNQFSVEAHKHKEMCFRLLTEFGLSPSSKSRVSAQEAKPTGLNVRRRA